MARHNVSTQLQSSAESSELSEVRPLGLDYGNNNPKYHTSTSPPAMYAERFLAAKVQ
jgi:hypothetical protein